MFYIMKERKEKEKRKRINKVISTKRFVKPPIKTFCTMLLFLLNLLIPITLLLSKMPLSTKKSAKPKGTKRFCIMIFVLVQPLITTPLNFTKFIKPFHAPRFLIFPPISHHHRIGLSNCQLVVSGL